MNTKFAGTAKLNGGGTRMKKKWMHGLAGAFVVGAFAFAPQVALAATGDVVINETNFPDAGFRGYISENFDQDGNGSLSSAEIADAKEIRLVGTNVSNLSGLSFFTSYFV